MTARLRATTGLSASYQKLVVPLLLTVFYGWERSRRDFTEAIALFAAIATGR